MIYDSIYNLIETYIFGIVQVGTYQELICILLSSVGCIFVFSLPFVLVWKVVKMFVN